MLPPAVLPKAFSWGTHFFFPDKVKVTTNHLCNSSIVMMNGQCLVSPDLDALCRGRDISLCRLEFALATGLRDRLSMRLLHMSLLWFYDFPAKSVGPVMHRVCTSRKKWEELCPFALVSVCL